MTLWKGSQVIWRKHWDNPYLAMVPWKKRVKFLEKIQWASSPLLKWGALTVETHEINRRGMAFIEVSGPSTRCPEIQAVSWFWALHPNWTRPPQDTPSPTRPLLSIKEHPFGSCSIPKEKELPVIIGSAL